MKSDALMTPCFPYAAPATADDHIDLWLTPYHQIVDKDQLAQLRRVLSNNERTQESRFHFSDDRKRYLVTRALIRTVLSKYSRVPPEEWIFSANRYGRPMIAERHGPACELIFNVSHTRKLIALAVTRKRAIGVDVENVVARPASLGVAQRFFSSTEVSDLAALPRWRQQERFFEYWVCKEAYVKARGMGLSIPLDKFSFTFSPDGIAVSLASELDDDARRWTFLQYRPGPEHLLALCCERINGGEPKVTVRQTIPFDMEEELDLPLLRASEPVAPANKRDC